MGVKPEGVKVGVKVLKFRRYTWGQKVGWKVWEEKYGGKVGSKFEGEMLGRKIGGKSIGPTLGVNLGVTSQKKLKTNIFVFVFGPENCIGHTLNLYRS